MLDTQEKVVMTDLNGKHDVSLEVNFSTEPDSKDKVRLDIGGTKAVVTIKDLYDFVFLVADAVQQERLMPVKQTRVKEFFKRHVVTVPRDTKKGQKLNFPCRITVPVETIEGLAGMFERKFQKNSHSIPIIKVK